MNRALKLIALTLMIGGATTMIACQFIQQPTGIIATFGCAFIVAKGLLVLSVTKPGT